MLLLSDSPNRSPASTKKTDRNNPPQNNRRPSLGAASLGAGSETWGEDVINHNEEHSPKIGASSGASASSSLTQITQIGLTAQPENFANTSVLSTLPGAESETHGACLTDDSSFGLTPIKIRKIGFRKINFSANFNNFWYTTI